MVAGVCNGHFYVFLVSCSHLHSQDGSMANNSLFVHSTVYVSGVDWCFQRVCRYLVFLNKSFVTVDTFCSTV